MVNWVEKLDVTGPTLAVILAKNSVGFRFSMAVHPGMHCCSTVGSLSKSHTSCRVAGRRISPVISISLKSSMPLSEVDCSRGSWSI